MTEPASPSLRMDAPYSTTAVIASDAAGGLLRRQADLAIPRAKYQIQNAKQLYDYGTKNLQNTKTQSMLRKLSIEESPSASNQCRALHQYITKGWTLLDVKPLTCFSCQMSSSGRYKLCDNISMTGSAREHIMVEEHCSSIESQSVSPEQTVSPGQIFTDEFAGYYLLKVTKREHTSEKCTRDSLGTELGYGIEILLKANGAVVPAPSLVYIFTELAAKYTNSLHRNFVNKQCKHRYGNQKKWAWSNLDGRNSTVPESANVCSVLERVDYETCENETQTSSATGCSDSCNGEAWAKVTIQYQYTQATKNPVEGNLRVRIKHTGDSNNPREI
ncbi:hypothetical protein MAR_021699, partial [Mya arenaria]